MGICSGLSKVYVDGDGDVLNFHFSQPNTGTMACLLIHHEQRLPHTYNTDWTSKS